MDIYFFLKGIRLIFIYLFILFIQFFFLIDINDYIIDNFLTPLCFFPLLMVFLRVTGLLIPPRSKRSKRVFLCQQKQKGEEFGDRKQNNIQKLSEFCYTLEFKDSTIISLKDEVAAEYLLYIKSLTFLLHYKYLIIIIINIFTLFNLYFQKEKKKKGRNPSKVHMCVFYKIMGEDEMGSWWRERKRKAIINLE